jgi:hypothetical protein
LHWYALSTARLLLRRWQSGALIIGVVAAANGSMFGNTKTLAQPLLGLLAPHHGIAWRGAYLAALLAAATLWASMQRAQIEGGAFMAFASSLPFSPRQRRQVDLAVLLLADSPLLLLAGGALTVTAARHGALSHLALLADVVLLALVTQLAALERRAAGWIGASAACCVLAAAFDTRAALAATLCIAAAAIFALGLGPRRRLRFKLAPLVLPVSAWPSHGLARLAGRHAPGLRIALAVLYRERRAEVVGKALKLAGVIAGAIALIEIFDRDTRSFATLLLAQGLVALSASGLYRGLHLAHRSGSAYTGALPLAPQWWRKFDLAVVLGFGLPFLAVLAAIGWWIGAAPPARIAAAMLSYALLLGALRAPQLASERHAVVLSVSAAGGWIAATIACLN